MFSPVGSQPPSVYWRRRIAVAGSLVVLLVLLVLTVRAVTSGGGDGRAAGATPPSSSSGSGTPAARVPATSGGSPIATSTAKPPSPSAPAKQGASAASGTARPTTSAPPAPPPACVAKHLAVAATVAKASYPVGQHPMLELQVTNKGSAPCVQDVGDSKVVLSVYNGESRVWGSHDCQVQPGAIDRTLTPGQPLQVTISWLGLTSQAKCGGTRQQVGPGTYTLYASLAGQTGTAAQFSMTAK